MSKYATINTLDFRLSMMGFRHPDSTQLTAYEHKNGDRIDRMNGVYGVGWYWLQNDTGFMEYRFSKRSIVSLMEEYYGICK